MPGPYAHITLIYELMQTGRLESHFTPESGFSAILENCFPYCALGAVSPDYPNLARWDDNAVRWADAMHCTRACEMIASGIRRVRSSKGAARDKQLAWLLGYCAHVATDVTIHPVVQAKVGAYAENQLQHRVCEMNQDSHIYRRMNLGEIGESDSFAMLVARCGDPDDKTQLDCDIVTLWHGMLEDVHPELFAGIPPRIASWHCEFVATAADCRAGEVRLFPLARVISSKIGLSYPVFDAVDRQFIDGQMVPSERPHYLGYDEIFDRAAHNVIELWRKVERAFCDGESTHPPVLGDWNLDDGRDEYGRLVFW